MAAVPMIVEPPPAVDPARVTYAEIRTTARWLNAFTASDLADALHCSHDVARMGVRALLWHGIALETEVELPGPDGMEVLIEMLPLPPGPLEHWTDTPPEIVEGYTEVLEKRGLPIRLVDNTKKRDGMQSPGSRRRLKDRDRAHERMQAAIVDRQAKDEARRRSKAEGRKVTPAEVKRAKAKDEKEKKKRQRKRGKKR